MKYNLEQLAILLEVYQVTIIRFCKVFELNFENQIELKIEPKSRYVLKNDFVEFMFGIKGFVKAFSIDFYTSKTPEYISELINVDIEVVKDFLMYNPPNLCLVNNGYNEYSSYEIAYKLGNKFSEYNFDKLRNRYQISNNNYGVVGYIDVLSSIKDQLSPIINPSGNYEWGLNNPGGILLFGPPGCGKTYWASIIAKMLNYDFQEIPRSVFGSSYVDGAMINLKNMLDEVKQRTKVVVFFDEFDSVASLRGNLNDSGSENTKIVNTLLQEIPKLIQHEIVIVGATNFIDYIDPAVVRPGRFDLKIPIFPPSPNEKIELILYHLLNGLPQYSMLIEILKINNMMQLDFWTEYSELMNLFSNSLIIDFTQLIKRKIKNNYQENKITKVEKEFILNSLNQVTAKITQNDIETYSQFYNEVKSLDTNIYSQRLEYLYKELELIQKKNKKDAPAPIGFRRPNI
jgi:transitional endoplasmic reticulum ATPase